VAHAYPHHWYGTVCVADLLHRRHVPFKTHGVLESVTEPTPVCSDEP
jgi:hypothetical protein